MYGGTASSYLSLFQMKALAQVEGINLTIKYVKYFAMQSLSELTPKCI